MPGLRTFHLYIHTMTAATNEAWVASPDLIFESLALLPSLSQLWISWYSLGDSNVLLEALASKDDQSDPNAPFTLLPVLEVLAIISTVAQPSQFVTLLGARWRTRKRTLESFLLLGCSAERGGEPFQTTDPSAGERVLAGWEPVFVSPQHVTLPTRHR